VTHDRDYGDENDYRPSDSFDEDDDFYLDPDFWNDDEDDDYEFGGALVPNEPSPSDPFLSASAIVEKEYILA